MCSQSAALPPLPHRSSLWPAREGLDEQVHGRRQLLAAGVEGRVPGQQIFEQGIGHDASSPSHDDIVGVYQCGQGLARKPERKEAGGREHEERTACAPRKTPAPSHSLSALGLSHCHGPERRHRAASGVGGKADDAPRGEHGVGAGGLVHWISAVRTGPDRYEREISLYRLWNGLACLRPLRHRARLPRTSARSGEEPAGY